MIMEFGLSPKPEARNSERKPKNTFDFGQLVSRMQMIVQDWSSGGIGGSVVQWVGWVSEFTAAKPPERLDLRLLPSRTRLVMVITSCPVAAWEIVGSAISLPSIIHVICIKSGSLQFAGDCTYLPPLACEVTRLSLSRMQFGRKSRSALEWGSGSDRSIIITIIPSGCRSSIFICCRW